MPPQLDPDRHIKIVGVGVAVALVVTILVLAYLRRDWPGLWLGAALEVWLLAWILRDIVKHP